MQFDAVASSIESLTVEWNRRAELASTRFCSPRDRSDCSERSLRSMAVDPARSHSGHPQRLSAGMPGLLQSQMPSLKPQHSLRHER